MYTAIILIAGLVTGLLIVLFKKSKPQVIDRNYPDYENLDDIYN